jgi:ATP-dependent DNA ligase
MAYNPPTLYAKSSTGKSMQWSIEVEETMGGGLIRTRHGYEGGKIQVNEKTITVGKNIGKANATTPLQQAIAEATSLWTKKRETHVPRIAPLKKKSDVTDTAATTSTGVSATDATAAPTAPLTASAIAPLTTRSKAVDDLVPSPMLAHDYNKRGKSIVWPCKVQPKLDGTRMVGISGKGLYSRNRKAYPHLEHIRAELDMLPAGTTLDGELYSQTLTFQEIVATVKNETLQPRQTFIKFYVYDMINGENFITRSFVLQNIFAMHKFQHLVLVKTEECANEAAMKDKHNEYVKEGYEGCMLRNKTGLYSNARSVHLQKYKEFFDMECRIVGFKEGEGAEEGCVIWICETEDKKQFACRPRGTREERQELFATGAEHVGKMLTVRYQEMTDDGLLRFPVGIAIRDYE